MRILIVEDDSDIGDIFRDYFKSKGHLVVLSEDGVNASVELWEKSFDVIITDLQMKIKSGKELIKSIRNSPKGDTPIIVVSGFIDAQARKEISQYSNVTMVDKPISTSKLEQIVLQVTKETKAG